MSKHICENCGNEFSGEYSNGCGQRLSHRITMGHIGHELAHAFTHADKGFLHLLMEMFVKPGIVAREYILEGKRKRYFTPFQYILIIGTIATFVAVNSHFIQAAASAMGGSDYSERQARLMGKIATWQGKYYNFIILFQLPFYAFGAYLIYRKYKLNYAKHLTLQTFITAQTTIFGMFIMGLVAVLGKPGMYIALPMSIISVAYQAFAYTQFFRERNLMGVLRAIVSNFLSFTFFLIALIITILITALLVYVFDRQAFQ